MSILKIVCCLFITLALNQAEAQKQGRKYINKLSSKAFSGRGYVNNGHIKASDYIEKKLKSFGYTTTFQKFMFPVNIFPGEISLNVNNEELKPGRDYVYEAGTPTIKGTFSVIILNRTSFLDAKKRDSILSISTGKFILITVQSSNDTGKKVLDSLRKTIHAIMNSPTNHIAGIINHDTAQTKWGIRQTVNPYPLIELNKNMSVSSITTITISVESELLKKCESRNVIGTIKGTAYPDSFIVITSHYDHIGMMGKRTMFPGANDNASGVAMMLCLAEYYAKHPQKYSIACISFGAEEVGLIGSKYYVKNPTIPLKNFVFMLHFDMVGTGEDGLKVVNGSELKRQFNTLKQLNDSLHLLLKVQPRVQGCISDQCYFFRNGVPCFFVYTMGGTKAYHDIYDQSKTLSLFAFENLAELSKLFITKLQE